MTKRKPSYCPYCGAVLVTRSFEERERRFCPTCQECIFQNPVPVARVVALDGDRALFVKRAQSPYQEAWTIPGGILEVDESAALGASRELQEEALVRTSTGSISGVSKLHLNVSGEKSANSPIGPDYPTFQ
ncbi:MULTISPECIES: NUDIX hydrolase [Halorussus]|uniref:NUDIX hydrolase n=1 Tax=Halorussus TaxID=1070314 RepID=UPI0034A4F0F1|nr:NUDIX domain-containing protein [Halorussus vallis]